MRFYAIKETVDALHYSVAAKVLLIGGFAGYWNFGDLLQLRGTIRWYENGYPSALLCPFVQLGTVGGTDSLARLNGLFGTEHWILYARSEDEGADLRAQSLGLEPLVPASTRSPTVLHTYGGGFFNRWWGDWVLNLIECVLRSFGVDQYLISGQQVGPEFADRLSRHCQLFRPQAVGCRDAQSGLLLQARGVEASESGDDAFEEVLLIAGSAEPRLQSLSPEPSFGLHLNLSPYTISTGSLDSEPDQIGQVLQEVDQYLRLLLDRYGQSACPMIIGAYSDQRLQVSDSWRSMDRALVTKYFPYFMGVDVVAMWNQARLMEAVPGLRALRLCVSSSYHVALLSQALHVPTYLLAWNHYYQQKQRGLMQGIRSFEEFLSADPQELVAEQMQFLSAQQESRATWLSRLSELMAKRLPTGSPRLPPNRPAEVKVTEPPVTESLSDATEGTERTSPSMPLVSVVIPTCNDAEFVGSAVQSALEQDYPNIEVIVVDDGSTDNTRDVLKPYLEDQQVRYLAQENCGLSPARNRGIAESRGEYLNFLDADDYLHPSKIGKQVRVLESEPSVDLVYCDVKLVDRNGQPIDDYSVGASRKILDGDIFDSLMLGGYFPLHAVLLRRRVLDQVGVFDEELPATEDLDLWLRASAEGFSARYIDEKLAYYRRYPGTMSQDEPTMRRAHVATVEKITRRYPARVARSIFNQLNASEELYAASQWLMETHEELQKSVTELEEAKVWLEQQAANWQRTAEEREETIKQEEAEIAALEVLVAGYESGRVMRVLNAAERFRQRVFNRASRETG